jgi:hypothetical protein
MRYARGTSRPVVPPTVMPALDLRSLIRMAFMTSITMGRRADNADAGPRRESRNHEADKPLSADAQKFVLDVTKQLLTLSVVALGFLTSMLFTTFKGTPFVASAMTSLFSFLLSAVCGVLAQLAVVAESMDDAPAFSISYTRLLLHLAWISFVCGLVAFVVFTWANVRAGS